jgi:hypothetical protein
MKTYSIYNLGEADYKNDIASIIDRKSKYMNLVFNTRSNVDYIFWRDSDMRFADGDSNRNFGWLTESNEIDRNSYDMFLANIDDWLPRFKYVFTNDRSLLEINEKIKWVPANYTWIVKPRVYSHKVNLVSMITSSKVMCAGHRKRLELAMSLKNSVDLYGRGHNPIASKEQGLASYMFSIAHENASYSGYFTEKVLDCFATGTIPIYWGDPDIGKIFNTDGIIMLDDFNLSDLTPELYYSKINAVKENCEIVKRDFMLVEDYMYDKYLRDDNGVI